MKLAVVYSRATQGMDSPLVTIETHLSNGLPGLSIVGLPETAVRESKDRVRSAIINSGFTFPQRRITINMAPADLPKSGGRFDLPIAVSILAASEQINSAKLSDFEFVGELALSGEVRKVIGVLPCVLATQKASRKLFLPKLNENEASLATGSELIAIKHLLEVSRYLNGDPSIAPVQSRPFKQICYQYSDIDEVVGQHSAKRALEIAAAGGHNILLWGPPGTGKSMLANRLPGILSDLNEEQALDLAAVQSLSNSGFNPQHWKKRPFRSPHHTASTVSMVGGGNPPKPGEVSLAHHGVLFLDELPEFDRKLLEALREPLQNQSVTISRAQHTATFPAAFQLVAAMNPCPCGNLGHPKIDCWCTPTQILRYQQKISGPFLDRIDLLVRMNTEAFGLLHTKVDSGCNSKTILKRVVSARKIQTERQGVINAHLGSAATNAYCEIAAEDRDFLFSAMDKLNLSARGGNKVLKTARTIADLEDKQSISRTHLLEALGYRSEALGSKIN